ncbi:hypothetical protein [Actinomadura chokoriensis]|uniref:hypothetical protein n=1 Tax=Actinomadura chokoriensis TaxID=454156 RepID=UPI0031F8AA92
MLKLGTGWYHLRGIDQVRRTGNETAARFAKAAAKQCRKLEGLLDFLQVPAAQVLDEALVRVDRNSLRVFVGCKAARAVHFWTVIGNLPPRRLEEFDVLNTVSGGCLWSSQGVQVTTEDDHPFDLVGRASSADLQTKVKEIRCADGLTGYEREITRRLDHSLAALVRGVRGSGLPEHKVTLDTPMGHYLLYIWDGAQKGLIPPRLREYWALSVLNHRSVVVEYSRELLNEFLRGRSTITQSTELSSATAQILQWLFQKHVPSLEEIVNLLTRDPVWRLLFDSLGRPRTVQEVNRYAYSGAILRRALPDGKNRSFVLEVGADSEGKIIDNVLRVAKKHPKRPFHAMAVLSAETFIAFTEGREGEPPGMYHNDPGNLLAFEDGRKITMEELLRRLYPSLR